MRFSLIFFLLLLGLLLTEEKKEKNGKKKSDKGERKKDTKGKPSCPNPIGVDDLEKGLNVSCPEGVLAFVNITGINDTCRGLTHDLFIQELQCHWKAFCLIKYNKSVSSNLMLKLKYDSTEELLTNSHCLTKTPVTFYAHFKCTKKVEVFPVLQERNTREIQVERGILLSHSDYPWLYDRANHNLTLRRPANGGNKFVYTFRDFHLWHKDELHVSWTKANEILFESYNNTFMRVQPSPEETRVLNHAETVTFTFTTAGNTGGKGFVICFSWSDTKNACVNMFEDVTPTCLQNKKKVRTPKVKKIKNEIKTGGKNGGKNGGKKS